MPADDRTVFLDRSFDAPLVDHAGDQAKLGYYVLRVGLESPEVSFLLPSPARPTGYNIGPTYR